MEFNDEYQSPSWQRDNVREQNTGYGLKKIKTGMGSKPMMGNKQEPAGPGKEQDYV